MSWLALLACTQKPVPPDPVVAKVDLGARVWIGQTVADPRHPVLVLEAESNARELAAAVDDLRWRLVKGCQPPRDPTQCKQDELLERLEAAVAEQQLPPTWTLRAFHGEGDGHLLNHPKCELQGQATPLAIADDCASSVRIAILDTSPLVVEYDAYEWPDYPPLRYEMRPVSAVDVAFLYGKGGAWLPGTAALAEVLAPVTALPEAEQYRAESIVRRAIDELGFDPMTVPLERAFAIWDDYHPAEFWDRTPEQRAAWLHEAVEDIIAGVPRRGHPNAPTEPPSEATTLASGVAIEVLKPGTGPSLPPGMRPVTQETFWTQNGRFYFDSREESSRPLHELLPGWQQAVSTMRVGETARIRIPDAYGGRLGWPLGTLIAEVELVRALHPGPTDAQASSAQSTESGLRYVVLEPGTGPTPQAAGHVHVTIWEPTGDLQVSRVQPELVGLNTWYGEGLARMAEGGTTRFWAPDGRAWDVQLLRAFSPPTSLAAPKTVGDAGWVHEVLRPGGDRNVTLRDTVAWLFIGWTQDGELWEASQYPRTKVGDLPKPWRDVLSEMSPGERGRVWTTVPIHRRRAPTPAGASAPADSMLTYDLEILEVVQ